MQGSQAGRGECVQEMGVSHVPTLWPNNIRPHQRGGCRRGPDDYLILLFLVTVVNFQVHDLLSSTQKRSFLLVLYSLFLSLSVLKSNGLVQRIPEKSAC